MKTAISVVPAGAFVAPNIEAAELPVNYARATEALATCERIDECKDWADKMAALASYAKQADDDTLHKLATRISARAIRRCGELLNQFDGRGGDRSKTVGAHSFARPSKLAAGDQAGMSPNQIATAVRLANVPEDIFEAAVESDDPPTVTHLAELGTKTKPAAEKFTEATHVIGVLHELAAFCAAHDAAIVGRAVLPHETRSLCADAAAVGTWLRLFLDHLPEAPAC